MSHICDKGKPPDSSPCRFPIEGYATVRARCSKALVLPSLRQPFDTPERLFCFRMCGQTGSLIDRPDFGFAIVRAGSIRTVFKRSRPENLTRLTDIRQYHSNPARTPMLHGQRDWLPVRQRGRRIEQLPSSHPQLPVIYLQVRRQRHVQA